MDRPPHDPPPPQVSAPSTLDHQPAQGLEMPPVERLQYIGEYRLESLLGKGAFGEVWRATQVSLQRTVAIKLLLAQHGAEDIIQRFRREAKLLAQLNHPHIVNVIEVNTDQGRHYIAMEFVDGVDLKQFIAQALPDCRWAAETMRTLAAAVAHAHAAGVVHRDLKPANLLLSKTQQLKVTDFGLAKGIAEEADLTLDGAVLGTLAYMPPEQALGQSKHVGPAADVYAIGATLYHLLTGRPPFPIREGLAPAAIYDEIRDFDPVPPRKLRPDRHIPRYLETICLKCLAKEPERRYRSAQELADDLDRYLQGEPIRAQPVAWTERAWLKVKKRPVVSALAAAALLAALVAAGLAGRGLQLSKAVVAQGKELETTKGEKSTAQALAAKAITDEQAARALALAEARQRTLQEYLADMNEAQELWDGGELGRLRDVLTKYERPGEYDPRGFEWHFLNRQLAAPAPLTFPSKGAAWNRISFSPDGQRLAGLDRDGTLVVWKLATGEEVYRVAGPTHSFAFTHDGTHCVLLRSAAQGTIEVIDALTGKSVKEFNAGLVTTCFALHPKEAKLLVGNVAGEMYLRELPSGKLLAEVTASYNDLALRRRSLDIEHGAIHELVFHPSGDLFAVGWEDGTVQLWHVADSVIDRRISISHSGCVTGLAFSPGGNLLASQSAGESSLRFDKFEPGDVKVTLLPSGNNLSKFTPHHAKLDDEPLLRTAQGMIPFGQFRPAFDPRGEWLFTTGNRAASRWNARTGEHEQEYVGHDGLVHAIAISGDGSQVAAAGADGTIRVWPSAGQRSYAVLCEAHGGIRSLALSPDGQHFAAICDQGIELRVPDRNTGLLSEPAALTDPMLWIWNAAGEKLLAQDLDFSNRVLQFNDQGRELWSGGQRYRLGAKTVSGTQPVKLAYGVEELCAPQQAFVARLSELAPAVELFRGEAGQPFAALQKHMPHSSAIAVSPDGQWIATGGADHLVCLWSTADGMLRYECLGHSGEITTLAFSPDSAHLLSGGLDRKLYAWEVRSGQRVASFPGHRREISGIAFSHDGRRFVSSSGALRITQLKRGESGEVRLWDLGSARLCIELKCDGEIYSGVAISADGQRIYAAANTVRAPSPGRIVMWDGAPAP